MSANNPIGTGVVQAIHNANASIRRCLDASRSILTIDIDATKAHDHVLDALKVTPGSDDQLACLARCYARCCSVRDQARDDYGRVYADQACASVAEAIRVAGAVNERTGQQGDQSVVAYHPLKR